MYVQSSIFFFWCYVASVLDDEHLTGKNINCSFYNFFYFWFEDVHVRFSDEQSELSLHSVLDCEFWNCYLCMFSYFFLI